MSGMDGSVVGRVALRVGRAALRGCAKCSATKVLPPPVLHPLRNPGVPTAPDWAEGSTLPVPPC